MLVSFQLHRLSELLSFLFLHLVSWKFTSAKFTFFNVAPAHVKNYLYQMNRIVIGIKSFLMYRIIYAIQFNSNDFLFP